MHITTSLYFSSLAEYRAAGSGAPTLPGQTVEHMDNGYGLQGNPGFHELQAAISRLEKGTYTLLYPSGSTALLAVGSLLKSGDHWLIPDSVYAPVRRYANYLQDHYGVAYDHYGTGSLESVRKGIKTKTKLIHIETPSSAIFATTDVEGMVKIAQKKGILTSADNTWAAGKLYSPLAHGVDISVLALTKYPSGYGDVFMGALTVNNKELYKQFAYHHRVHGYTVSPISSMLVLRGLESVDVRLAGHGANAKKLIAAVKDNSKVAKVYFVDIEKNREFSGINGLFSIELDRYYNDEELEKAFSNLSTFKIGESWGGTRSLVLPFQPEEFSSLFSPSKNTIIRFHAGLENVELQIKDALSFLRSL